MPKSKKRDMVEDAELNIANKKRAEMDLICSGKICRDPEGNIVIDLRETDCPPDKAREFLTTITNPEAKVTWKMPGLLTRIRKRKKWKQWDEE